MRVGWRLVKVTEYAVACHLSGIFAAKILASVSVLPLPRVCPTKRAQPAFGESIHGWVAQRRDEHVLDKARLP